jgi:hypothetical protein
LIEINKGEKSEGERCENQAQNEENNKRSMRTGFNSPNRNGRRDRRRNLNMNRLYLRDRIKTKAAILAEVGIFRDRNAAIRTNHIFFPKPPKFYAGLLKSVNQVLGGETYPGRLRKITRSTFPILNGALDYENQIFFCSCVIVCITTS